MYIKLIEFKDRNYTDTYPFNLPAIKNIGQITFEKNISILIGENGSGKSTILEAIAGLIGLNFEGGSTNNLFSTKDTHSELFQYCKLVKYPRHPKDRYFYRAETFYNLITDLDYLGISTELFEKNLHDFSRGESFKELINNRFFGNGIYILDEPETGLSIQSQLEIIIKIKELASRESQFIIATHSPIMLLIPNADIFEITSTGIFKRKAEETELMKMWEILINRKSNFINMLFEEQ